MDHPSLRSRLLRSAIALALVAGTSLATAPLGASALTTSRVTTYPTPPVQTAGRTVADGSTPAVAPLANRGARKHAVRSSAGTSTAQAPAALSAGQRNSAGLLENFNGVSSLDSEVTNTVGSFVGEFEPPDQGLCAGNGFVLEPVNSAYRVYRTNGQSILGPINVNLPPLFHRGPLDFTSDPRCYFDASTNTWFATILFIATKPNGSFSNSSTIDISVNPSGDPTTNWTTYSIDTTDGHNHAMGCPCFGDQPRFGIDAHNLYLSSDEFSILGPQFNGAQLYAVSKSDLVNLAPSIHFAHFSNPLVNGSQVFAIEPATTNGAANAEYFLSALDENLDGSTVNQVAVWAMTNVDGVAAGVAPILSSLVISSEGYSVPPKAEQMGNAAQPLDSGDDRMQQAEFINGTIWAELDTGISIAGDSAPRAGAAWFNVVPSISGGVLSSAVMARQGYVALAGSYLLYPAIQADSAGNAAMVVSVSSANQFPSAAFTTLSRRASGFGPIQVAAAGTGPYFTKPTAPPGRWGDYSYASLDPATDTVWLATEYVPPVSSQTTDGFRNWGTNVMQVGLGG